MNRTARVITITLCLFYGAGFALGEEFRIQAANDRVLVQSDQFQASARIVSHDKSNGRVLLAGTSDDPVLFIAKAGRSQRVEIRAIKIIYSLIDGTIRADAVESIDAASSP